MTATHVTLVVTGEEEKDEEGAMSEDEGGGGERHQAAMVVPMAQVVSLEAIECTLHQVQEARKHVVEHFAGAKYTKARAVRKGGLKPAEASEVAKFLRDKTVVEHVSE